MMDKSNDMKKLLCEIHEYEFMVIDLALYLDTHPDCMKGLEAYHMYNDIYERKVREYEKDYGPLTIYSEYNDDYWTWSNGPWPWEVEAN